jgi:hypothetical protein
MSSKCQKEFPNTKAKYLVHLILYKYLHTNNFIWAETLQFSVLIPNTECIPSKLQEKLWLCYINLKSFRETIVAVEKV